MSGCSSTTFPRSGSEVDEEDWLEFIECSTKDASSFQGRARFAEPERLAAVLGKMLNFLQDRVSERKLRLYAAACCRRVLHLAPLGARQVVAIAERFADGEVDSAALSSARDAAAATLWPK